MGILSDVGDSIAAAVDNRGLFGSVNSEFKRFASTDLGKGVLLAAAIYFGGGAAGWWDTPFTAAAAGGAEGAAGGTAFGGGIDAAAITPEAVLAPAETTAGSGAGFANMGSANPAAFTPGGSAMPAVAPPVAAAPPVAPGVPAPTAAVAGANAGTSAGTGATGNWFTRLPGLAQYGLIQGGLGAVQNAFTPNALDVAKEQARLAQEAEDRRRAVWNQNWNVRTVNPGISPAGIINGNMGVA